MRRHESQSHPGSRAVSPRKESNRHAPRSRRYTSGRRKRASRRSRRVGTNRMGCSHTANSHRKGSRTGRRPDRRHSRRPLRTTPRPRRQAAVGHRKRRRRHCRRCPHWRSLPRPPQLRSRAPCMRMLRRRAAMCRPCTRSRRRSRCSPRRRTGRCRSTQCRRPVRPPGTRPPSRRSPRPRLRHRSTRRLQGQPRGRGRCRYLFLPSNSGAPR